MGLKAIFFDLDDTLVLTSLHDERAYAAVSREAERECSKIKVADLISDFKKCLKQSPWDPGYPTNEEISVTEHRGRLWATVLQMQPEAFSDVAQEASEAFRKQAGSAPEVMVSMMSQAAGMAAMESATSSLGSRFQETFDRQRLADLVLVDGSTELIMRLKSRGLAVVIITAGHEEIQWPKLKACRAADIVGEASIIVGGDELRAGRQDKPSASIFLKACDLVGCEPSEAIMVGDSLSSDIQGAINANLAASLWVNASRKDAGEGAPQPSAQIASVLELEDALAKLGFL